MKYIKYLIKSCVIVILLTALFVTVVLAIDSYETDYLKVTNNPKAINTSYILNHVNIVPMTKDTVLFHKSVWIENGMIKQILDSDSLLNKNIEVIEGNNKFLSPGLIDMHVHIWDRYELGLYLANGVTAVRNLWGYPMHLRIKEEINTNKILGPTFFTSSPKLTGARDLGDDKVQIPSPEAAKALVVSYKKRGFDFIKTYAGLSEVLFNAIAEQAKASHIKIVSHPSRNMPYLDQFNPQIVSLEHMEEIVQEGLNYTLDSSKVKPIIQKFVDTKTSFCPTLTGYYKIYEMLNQQAGHLNPNLIQYINPLIKKTDSKVQFERWQSERERNPKINNAIYNQHQFHLYVLKKMQENGVNIVCGTDAGIGITAPGFSIHEELKFYKQAGLSNYNVLKTATVNPSKTHSEFGNMGTIEEGKVANLILTNANPLEELETLQNPIWVIVKGHKVDKDTLLFFENKAKNRNGFLATAIRYAEYLWVEK